MLYIAFFWASKPILQIIAMNLSNILILIYHGMSEPFQTVRARRLDFFNEACLGLITYFLFMYNDFLPDEDLKYFIGWGQVGILGFNISVNCWGVLVSMIKDTFKLIQARYFWLKKKLFKTRPVEERHEE